MRDWLAHRARATPTATAVIAAETGERCSYGDLDERVEELAGRLAARGLGVDDHLGVCMDTSLDFVELVHAAMRLGAVLVPLSPRLTSRELRDRLDAADVTVVVGDSETEELLLEAVVGTQVPVASIDSPEAGAADLRATRPETFDLPAWNDDTPQVLMFTSGTTGEPKAVVVTTGNLLSSAMASSWRLGVLPSDRWHCALPMYHMGGLAPVYRSVCYGTAIVVEEEDFDPAATLEQMAEHDATCVSLVPTMLRRLLDAGDLPDLRFVLLGGAPAGEDLLAACHERGVPVAPTYGMTETASQIATAHPEDAAAELGTVGHPLMFTEVTVVGENGAICEAGERGELVVSGPTVTPGYYGDRSATAASFGPHGFHTGDVGYRDEEGRFWVTGRVDDLILSGGENIDPAEVAGVIREHADVEDVAVVGLPDEEWGERVGALVVGDLSVDALESHCRDRLAGFKRPRTVGFADALPRTASGTVDREAVRARLSSGE
ncbi:o-succinylbenzoate--CoA ligase [Natronomonas sp. EA1]|uniref:o-succinylbenzoate--CoA ligase n=1 Tax=Natronomonas sp. EA1 TaxID=3421655 RepID=UPI003EBF77E2